MRVLIAAEMRALDAATIAAGTPGHVLMERAGRGAAAVATRMIRGRRGSVVVLCGRGNNGGDGFVVARRLRRHGRPVEVWLAGEAARLEGDAARMADQWRRAGGKVRALRTDDDVAAFRERCAHAALLVDALFGTGLNSPVAAVAAAAVEAMNAAAVPTLAIDMPSGLSADTGMPLGVAVRATETVTFGLAKVGQCLYPGVEHAGRLHLIDIGLLSPDDVLEGPATELLEAARVGVLLPKRPPGAHKGTFGHVLVVAGSRGKLGAALLAAEGAARAGAGLTTLAVPGSLQPLADGRIAEVMTESVPDDGGFGHAGDGTALAALVAGRSAVVCGPGLGQGTGPRSVVGALIEGARVPLVLDADGLNAIAGTDALRRRAGATIATPHPGEMARLLGGSVADVQADRLGVARRFAAEARVVLVLKGARTIVAAPDGRAAICPTGNPALASGGSGDVLAGATGGLLAQGLAPFEAAAFAVFAHGMAADALAERRGGVGLLARDLLAELPATIAALQGTTRP